MQFNPKCNSIDVLVYEGYILVIIEHLTFSSENVENV